MAKDNAGVETPNAETEQKEGENQANNAGGPRILNGEPGGIPGEQAGRATVTDTAARERVPSNGVKNRAVGQPYRAQLLSAELINTANGKRWLLTFGKDDNTTSQEWVNETFYDKSIKGVYLPNAYVEVGMEKTEKMKTTYFRKEDQTEYFHLEDGLRFTGLRRITRGMFEQNTKANQNDIDMIVNAGEASNAVAAYLGRVRAAQIGIQD